MIITLINPPAVVARYNYSTLSHPPVGLAYIASFLRQQGHTVHIIDAIGEGIDRFVDIPGAPGFFMQGISFEEIVGAINNATRLVGFSCFFTHSWPLVRQLIARVKQAFPHVPLIAGGEHATAMARFCLTEAPLDLCVAGEGEETTAHVVQAIESGLPLDHVPGIVFVKPETGEIVRTPSRPRLKAISRLPWPAWDAVSPHVYRLYVGPRAGATMPMIGSRGCPFQCTFCSACRMWGRRWEKREPGEIVDEMEHYVKTFGTREFQFFDISPFISKEWTSNLCREIINRKMKVSWQAPTGTRAEVIDDKVASLLVASGCTRIQFALESGSPAVLKAMNKKIDISRFESAVESALAAGMSVCVIFILGYPQETLKDICRTYGAIRRLAIKGVHEIAISSFVPLPGTIMFEQLLARNEIQINDDYCRKMAGATALTHATSWNPKFSGRQLLLLKWLGIIQFYGLSFLLHPSRGFRIIRNVIRGVQESKTDRAIAEVKQKIAILMARKSKR